MVDFTYFMPTKIFYGKDCVIKNGTVLSTLGKKAMIVTGHSSAKKNGALTDIRSALEWAGIAWILFDAVEENPSVQTVEQGAALAREKGVDFFIGIGGGSPMDAAKAMACLAANPQKSGEDLYGAAMSHLPVVAIPTTAGTGSEVTQFSVLTRRSMRTKASISTHVFPVFAFLDGKYMDTLSARVTNETAVDALSHLTESYFHAQSNIMSEIAVESGFSMFAKCIPALRKRNYTSSDRQALLLASNLGGIAIAQTGTSLPHGLGYFLTYEKGIPHGRANGLLMGAYLDLFMEKEGEKIQKMLSLLGFSSLDELKAFFKEVLDTPETFSDAQIKDFTKRVMETPAKLASFPYPVTEEMIYELYAKSLL